MTRLAGDVGANRQSSRHCKGISGHGIVVGPDGSAVGATAYTCGVNAIKFPVLTSRRETVGDFARRTPQPR